METQIKHLTLGDLIQELKNYDAEAFVQFDFGGLYATHFMSWRGSYEELCLGYGDAYNKQAKTSIGQLLEECNKADGATYTGYKGGEYYMDRGNRIWVSEYGHSACTAIVGVMNLEYVVILETAYIDYAGCL